MNTERYRVAKDKQIKLYHLIYTKNVRIQNHKDRKMMDTIKKETDVKTDDTSISKLKMIMEPT